MNRKKVFFIYYLLIISKSFINLQRKKNFFQNAIDEIPIRARSQSWLIRTRKLLDDEKVSYLSLI